MDKWDSIQDPETDSIFQNALIISSILISQRRKKQMMSSTYVDVTFENFNYPSLIQEENIFKNKRKKFHLDEIMYFNHNLYDE